MIFMLKFENEPFQNFWGSNFIANFNVGFSFNAFNSSFDYFDELVEKLAKSDLFNN